MGPETRYARSGDVSIAYQVSGDGPFDILFVPPSFSHVELAWEIPGLRKLFERLGTLGRLIHFDKRGTGMSDRGVEIASLETRMDDVRAVISAEAADFPELIARSGSWEAAQRSEDPDRVLATVLFTDIVDSTARMAELGDTNWRKLVEQHHALVRRELNRARGREVDTAGDGFFASFDGPARAVRCARSIVEGVRELGIDVRSGLEFEDRGVHEPKGVPGEWRLYAAV